MIARARNADVDRVGYDSHAGILSRKSCQNVWCFVAGAVVNDNKLKVSARLVKDTLHRLRNCSLTVLDSEHDGGGRGLVPGARGVFLCGRLDLLVELDRWMGGVGLDRVRWERKNEVEDGGCQALQRADPFAQLAYIGTLSFDGLVFDFLSR